MCFLGFGIFWSFFLCYCSKKNIELFSNFLWLVVKLSFVFRTVGCTVLCFFMRMMYFIPCQTLIKLFLILESILHNSFLYSFLSNLKENVCNFWTVGVVNLFVPGIFLCKICCIFNFCFELMSKYLFLSMVCFLF